MIKYTTDFGQTIDLELVDRAFVFENEGANTPGYVVTAFMIGTGEQIKIKAFDGRTHKSLAEATKFCWDFLLKLPPRPDEVGFIESMKKE